MFVEIVANSIALLLQWQIIESNYSSIIKAITLIGTILGSQYIIKMFKNKSTKSIDMNKYNDL